MAFEYLAIFTNKLMTFEFPAIYLVTKKSLFCNNKITFSIHHFCRVKISMPQFVCTRQIWRGEIFGHYINIKSTAGGYVYFLLHKKSQTVVFQDEFQQILSFFKNFFYFLKKVEFSNRHDFFCVRLGYL